MGQIQSQEIDRFISDNINTTAIANVISNYATRTDAVVVNTQDLCVDIIASGNINFGDGFTATQRIESMIDIDTLIDRSDKDRLVNDLQTVVSNELKDAIDRVSSGIGILDQSSIQNIRDNVINNINTYVNQTININTIDSLLLSVSNVQNGCYRFYATNVSGPITITQSIQSNMMATNIVKQVVEKVIENTDIQSVNNDVQSQVQSTNTGSAIGSLIFYIIGAIAIVISIVVAYLLPVGIKPRVAIVSIGIIIGIVMIVIGIIRGNTKKSKVM